MEEGVLSQQIIGSMSVPGHVQRDIVFLHVCSHLFSGAKYLASDPLATCPHRIAYALQSYGVSTRMLVSFRFTDGSVDCYGRCRASWFLRASVDLPSVHPSFRLYLPLSPPHHRQTTNNYATTTTNINQTVFVQHQ